MMEQQEVEEVSFLPGEAILNKKAVYEPTKGQKFRQIVCSKTWALCILFTMALIIIAVAAMAAFARPGFSSAPACGNSQQMINGTSGTSAATAQPKKLVYVATNGEPFPWHGIRLPKSIVPQSYDIFLHPNISASFFEGDITMTAAVKEKTDFVVFHTLELNLTAVKVSFITSSGANVRPGDQSPSGSSQGRHNTEKETELKVVKELEFVAHQQMYVKLDQMLEAGRVIKIRVGFRGSLAGLDRMNGFYKSSYKVNGEQRYMASTQFEASSARRAFPCFDEPELKATFSMSIVRNSNHITLFNTPLKTTNPYQKTLMVDNYEKTVRMSTYLLAYVVCDFKSISSKTKDGVIVRVFAPEDKIYMGQYALDGAVKIIEYYNDFFGIAYPLSKQDLIAIPNFAAGAMENWGLITYRDTAILYDPKVSTQRSKEWVATVVAHELAHQWFGNLVTMMWWSDIWLNEGFATFMEYVGADVVDKDFHMDVKYTEALTEALYLDSLSSSHPIEIPVHDPVEIEAAFDSISYDKGACLIHMLRGVIGPANFKKGLSDYLHQHAYGNAETKDLWDAFEKVSNLPGTLQVDKVMNTWTKQMGYPLVTVTQKAGKLFLTQERFLLNRNTDAAESKTSPFGYKWNIPFTYSTSEEPQTAKTVWMEMGSAEATLLTSIAPAWVKGNVQSQGYYRVNYDESGWKAISQQLKIDHKVFSVQDRVGLLDDVFSLAWTGIIDYSIALDLSMYLVKETNYFVWATAMGHLNSLMGRLYLHESYDNLQALMLSLVKPMFDSMGWDDKGDHLEKKMRSLLIGTAVGLRYQPAVDKAKSFFELWKANQNISLNNNLRGLIYRTGVKHGTKKDWDLVFQRYQKCKVPSETILLLNSLSASSDARILQILMEYSMDSQKIKSQDTSRVISMVAGNPVGFLYSWRFLRDKWDIFFKRYGHGSFTLKSIVKAVVQKFSTQFDYDEITAFFEGKDLGSATMGLKQAKEVVMSHIIWEKKNLDKVSTWLQDPGQSFNKGR